MTIRLIGIGLIFGPVVLLAVLETIGDYRTKQRD